MEKPEAKIPHTYYEEISISEEIAKEILVDDTINVSNFNWYVVNKNARILALYDVLEEHGTYDLIGYRKE